MRTLTRLWAIDFRLMNKSYSPICRIIYYYED
jgi:hypothetical protein